MHQDSSSKKNRDFTYDDIINNIYVKDTVGRSVEMDFSYLLYETIDDKNKELYYFYNEKDPVDPTKKNIVIYLIVYIIMR